jgi:hypothetical protein
MTIWYAIGFMLMGGAIVEYYNIRVLRAYRAGVQDGRDKEAYMRGGRK